ncbi:MAG: hypothetical protein KA716_25955 [Gloeotrichia echinulata DEX184]|nr:hypothetical protein [Gloeotrichia echinulata DEX184]
MTIHCSPGQRATLYYEFNSNGSKSFSSFDDQIDVTVLSNIPPVDNYDPSGYKISVWLSDPFNFSVGGYGYSDLTVKGYKIETLNPNYGYPFWILRCDNTYVQVGFITPSDINKPITKDTAFNCSGAIEQIDTLVVKDVRTGALLLTIGGRSPVKYNVVCGDGCPPGTCKCPSPNYPGYCCLPCSQIAGEIAAIAAIARSKH